MAESVVSLTYGTALYEAAKELGKTEKMMEEIIQLSKVIQQNLDLKEFLDSPAIAIEEKKEKSTLNLIILIGSVLFFLSDFMLLFNVFSSVSAVFGILCLALYYPAEFLLAHSILHTMEKTNDKE